MTSIAIVGGHGQVARLLHPLLTKAGHQPVALVRNPDHAPELEASGAEVRLLDIEQTGASGFAKVFEGCDAVVFAAGGGPDGSIDRKRTVDLQGSQKSIAAAKARGIQRFVQVSAIGVDSPPDPGRGDVWTAYVAAKRDADAALRESGLAWTILRPGRLTDAEPTGGVALGFRVERADVPRGDVAATLAAILDEPASVGHQWNLVSGDVPVADTVRAASQVAPGGMT